MFQPCTCLRSLVMLSAALLALYAAPAAHAQTLLGQDVHQDYLFPTQGALYENDGTQTITASGITFNSFGMVDTLVTPNQIKTTFNASATFTTSSFNGIHLTEVGGSPITITGVTVDPATTIAGFDSSRITFDATNIFANFQSLSFTPGDNITLNVHTAAAVPEPGSLALLSGMGVTGSLLAARRLRRRKH